MPVFQLAVNGGKAHRAALPPQFLRQLRRAQGLLAACFQTAEHRLLLLGAVWHGAPLLLNMRMKIIFILYPPGKKVKSG